MRACVCARMRARMFVCVYTGPMFDDRFVFVHIVFLFVLLLLLLFVCLFVLT